MPSLFDAYLAGDAAEFFPTHFAVAQTRSALVARVARPLAPRVADALAAQNARLAPSPRRDAHLAALRSGAAAVVTGQQVGLFLGPLFTIYKAATAIRAAAALSHESGRAVVPVFWLQTEDHDLPEIAACQTPSAHGDPFTSQLAASADDRISIAHRVLPEEVAACVAALSVEVGHLPHAAAHLSRLARHYRPGCGWATAFAGVLGELFAAQGLVLVDPRDAALAEAAAPVHRRALREAEPLADRLLQRSAALQRAGYEPAVHVRASSPLSFFHPDGAAGPRYRLMPERDGWGLVGRDAHITRELVLERLAADPLTLSGSALLRPIVQDTLLPAAAYVGGPGEVAYFAQMAPLYEAFALTMPLIVPRARLRVVEASVARQLRAWRLTPDDARRSEDEMLAAASAGTEDAVDAGALAAQLLDPFKDGLAAIAAQCAPLDDGVRKALDKTRGSVEASVARLIAKLEQARHHRQAPLVEAVRRVRQRLYPNGAPQERVYGLAYFAARYGEAEFLAAVLDAARPFETAPRDLAFDAEGA